jgi:hypothetical protein
VKGYFNDFLGGLTLFELPCTGTAMCAFQIGILNIARTNVEGGPFGSIVTNAAFTTPTGVFTGTIGFNGTIVGVGSPVRTGSGLPFSFMLPSVKTVGFPATTGRLSISVSQMIFQITLTEMFKRTGTDARDANGIGVIALVTGSMSQRFLGANRTWITLEIPEPSAILAASAGLFVLFACHQLVRRRDR